MNLVYICYIFRLDLVHYISCEKSWQPWIQLAEVGWESGKRFEREIGWAVYVESLTVLLG